MNFKRGLLIAGLVVAAALWFGRGSLRQQASSAGEGTSANRERSGFPGRSGSSGASLDTFPGGVVEPVEGVSPRIENLAHAVTASMSPTPSSPASMRWNVYVYDDQTYLPVSVPVEIASMPMTNSSTFSRLWTDADGAATIETAPGSYRLAVNHTPDRRVPGLEDSTVNVDVSTPGQAVEVRLRRADRRLSVVTSDSYGTRIPGIELRAVPLGTIRTTNEKGEAVFESLPPRQLVIEVAGNVRDRQDVCIPAPASQGVDMTIATPQSMEFRFERRQCVVFSIEGDATATFSNALLARVMLVPITCRCAGFGMTSGELRAGQALSMTVPVGSYRIRCEVGEGMPYVISADREIVHVDGDGPEQVRLTSVQVPGVLEGTVLGPEDKPVAHLRIRVYSSREDGVWNDFTSGRLAVTDDAGHFVVMGLADRPLRVWLYPDQCDTCQDLAFAGTAEEPYVSFRGPSKGVVIRMEQGYTIKGRVRADDKIMISGTVAIDRERVSHGAQRTLSFDTDGGFVFGHLRRGAYVLTYRDSDGVEVGVSDRIDVATEGDKSRVVDRIYDIKQ